MCGYSVKSGCGYSSDYSRYRSGFSPTSCGGGCGGSVSSCGGGCLCSSRYPFNGIIKLDNMTQEELNKVLEAHKHYIAEDCDGWSTMRADFRNMNLCGTDFSGADLSYSDLRGANLNGANLSDANLYGVKYNESTACFSLVCPEEGDFIGWKNVYDAIIKLRIPAEAKRSSATTRKCRCEFAEVLELQNLDGTPYRKIEIINKNYEIAAIYKVGEVVRPDSWDDNRWNECSHGIHFFMTRDEAVEYSFI